MSTQEKAIECFAKHLPKHCSAEQRQAFEQFKKVGVPTRKHEDWRYTSLLQHIPFLETLNAPDVLNPAFLEQLSVHPYCLLYNGVPVAGKDLLAQATPISATEGLVALNSALTPAAIQLSIPKALSTVYLINVVENALSHSQIHVNVAGANTQLIQINLNVNGFSNNVTQIHLEPGSHLTHTVLQQGDATSRSVTTLNATLSHNAHYHPISQQKGGAVNRIEITVFLTEPEAKTDYHGLLLGDNHEHLDLTLTIRHQAQNTHSNTLVRGIMHEHSRGVFSGKIVVSETALDTEAHLENKNLLTSEHAEMNTRPQLEIYTDRVACTHGATVGSLDPEMIFYLKSRGIPEPEAKALLIDGFIEPITSIIPTEATDCLQRLLDA